MAPWRRPILPAVDARVAVHGEDPADALERAVGDDVGSAAGQHLLGGLEDQPDRTGQQALAVQFGEHQAGAEHHGGVDVVTAGVGAVGHGGPVGAAGLHVGDGQRVDVGAQGEHGGVGAGLLVRPDVTDHPGPAGEYAGAQAHALQALLDRGGRAELLVAQFRVHVEVSPERHEFRAQCLGQRAGEHRSPGEIDLGLQ